MQVVFVSNYYNHHQAPFSEAMYELTKGQYCFVETESMSQERTAMGWGMAEIPSFVIKLNSSNSEEVHSLIDSADVVIIGSAPEQLIKNRLRNGKLVCRYSERWYKEVFEKWKWPYRVISHYFKYGRYKNTYMLCASAYTAADCAKTFLYRNKTFKWGYFPEVKEYDIDKLISEKDSASILWAGRLIGLKHPDASIRVCARLKSEGYRFHLTIIGNGEMEQQLNSMIQEYGLSDCVYMAGSMKPEQVRKFMEKAGIYLFTSDYNEGWGAVLNESMNSGCAVVASHAIGSVPFLVKDGENGLIYQSENEDQLYQRVRELLDDSNKQKSFGKKAYETMINKWNAKEAAKRLMQLVASIANEGSPELLFTDGPCSKASSIENEWYKVK